jgi:hypothetical protein
MMDSQKTMKIIKIIFILIMIYFIYNTIENRRIKNKELQSIRENFNPLDIIKLVEKLPDLLFNVDTVFPTVMSFVPKVIQISQFIFGLIGSVMPFSK